MKSQIYNRGGPIYQKVKKVAKPPPFITLEPPPPPQRRRLDTDDSFELVGVSEVLGELELIANRFDLDTVEIEDLQTDEFARNFNTPLTNLNDPMIV